MDRKAIGIGHYPQLHFSVDSSDFSKDPCLHRQAIDTLPQQHQGLSTSGIDGSTAVDVDHVQRLPSSTTGVLIPTDGHSEWH